MYGQQPIASTKGKCVTRRIEKRAGPHRVVRESQIQAALKANEAVSALRAVDTETFDEDKLALHNAKIEDALTEAYSASNVLGSNTASKVLDEIDGNKPYLGWKEKNLKLAASL